jgi:predicted Na+-dependent transporter
MESVGLVIFLFLVGIAVGSEINLEDFEKLKDTKAAFGIGCFCQFVLMPFCGVVVTTVVDLESITSGIPSPAVSAAAYALGSTLMWAAPGGSTSNLFTFLAGGNVPLSVAMSVCSNCVALFWYPFLVYVLWTLRFGEQANTGECSLNMPIENMLFATGVSCLAVFCGVALKRFGSEKLRDTAQKICSVASLVFLILLTMKAFEQIQKNVVITPLKILLGVMCQPVGAMLGVLLSKICGQPMTIARTIAFETGVQNFGLPITVIQLSFHPEAPFIGEMISAPLMACCAYPLWSILMVIIFRIFSLKEADKEMVDAEEEAPDVPEMLQSSPSIPEEEHGKPNPLSSSDVSVNISNRSLKKQKSLRNQKSTIFNMEPIRDPDLVPQELADSMRNRKYRVPFTP